MRSRFDEAKIKMVMKLKKLTRRAAVAEIARLDAARRKAAEEEAARAAERKAMLEARREAWRSHRDQSANISRCGDSDGLVSAKEFFGEN